MVDATVGTILDDSTLDITITPHPNDWVMPSIPDKVSGVNWDSVLEAVRYNEWHLLLRQSSL